MRERERDIFSGGGGGSNKYLRVAVDLFTKRAWAEPVRVKSAPAVWAAMQRILQDIGENWRPAGAPATAVYPHTAQSDNGSEFKGEFAAGLLANGINQVFSTPTSCRARGRWSG